MDHAGLKLKLKIALKVDSKSIFSMLRYNTDIVYIFICPLFIEDQFFGPIYMHVLV